MRQFIVIGLGNFGSTIARGLYTRGCQVLAIDIDKDRIQELKDSVSQAMALDIRDKEAISSLPIQPTDLAIVSLGDEMEVSILATLYLRELGLTKIVVKAISEDHSKILKRIGASDVIFPEQEMALRLADRLAHPNVLDFISLAEGFSMAELLPLESFFGNTLIDIEIRRKYGLEVVVIKHAEIDKDGNRTEKIRSVPSGDYVIERDDILVVVGEDKFIENYRKMKH